MNGKNLLLILFGLLFLTAGYGCSVGMAMSGKDDPNLAVVSPGEKRDVVKVVLGEPIKVARDSKGHRVETYEYEVGNEPSAARAFMHGTFDVLTIGLWEVIGTPVEAVQGDKFHINVTYDEENRVLSVGDPVKVKEQPEEVKTETACEYC